MTSRPSVLFALIGMACSDTDAATGQPQDHANPAHPDAATSVEETQGNGTNSTPPRPLPDATELMPSNADAASPIEDALDARLGA